MRGTRRCSGLLVTLILLVPAFAQQSGNLAEIHINRIKPSMTQQYEAGRKKHMGWHKNQKDMDDLLPFMLQGGREAASLPYVFRNSYGAVAVPYLRKAVAQANSPFARLQAAFQLVHLSDNTGIEYLLEAVLHRGTLPNGTAQAGEIRQFATNYMGFPKDAANMEDLVKFLKSKL